MAEKRALHFPKWLEVGVIALLLVMAGIEYTHGQWMWAGIFAIAGVLFGVSFGVRLLTGEKHEPK